MAEITQPVNLDKTIATRRTSSVHWIHVVPAMLIVLVVVTTLLLLASFEASYADRIYPGVTVWNVDMGGLTYDEAVALVESSFPYINQPALVLRDGDRTWKVRPAEIGARLDSRAVVDQAYSFGRKGNLIEQIKTQADVWRTGRQLPPVILFDPAAARAYMDQLALTLNRPAQDAGLRLENTAILTTSAVAGRMLEVQPVVAAMQAAVLNMQPAEIMLPFHDVQPSLADTELPRRELEKLLGSSLLLVDLSPSGEEANSWTIAPDALAKMVTLHRENDQILVKLDEAQLRALLEPIAPSLVVSPTNGRYVFDDETAQFMVVAHSADGRELDIPATLAQISQQAFTDNRRVPLVFRALKAEYHDGMTPQELGITQLISEGVTYYAGSSATRIKNIKVAASKFHGIIIAPGETFSFDKYLGDVSLDQGYEEALIIFEGRTVQGVGGGVCQVSTTAFRAAFQAGFPIVERWPHAYRVGWYERGPSTGFQGPGLDATVFAPLVDFKFTNDTPYHLLIETYTGIDGSLTFKFYSTSDGRKVTIDKPEVSNIVPHGPDIHEDDPTLAPGEVKQVDWAVDGADVNVHRTVERDGTVLYDDNIFTRYEPWQAVFKVGPQPPPEATPTP
jgi:vancomycin resistance protein YoaR